VEAHLAAKRARGSGCSIAPMTAPLFFGAKFQSRNESVASQRFSTFSARDRRLRSDPDWRPRSECCDALPAESAIDKALAPKKKRLRQPGSKGAPTEAALLFAFDLRRLHDVFIGQLPQLRWRLRDHR
jgi:hypothetical protein